MCATNRHHTIFRSQAALGRSPIKQNQFVGGGGGLHNDLIAGKRLRSGWFERKRER